MTGLRAASLQFLCVPIIFVIYTVILAAFVTHLSKLKIDESHGMNISAFRFPSSAKHILDTAEQLKIYNKIYPWRIGTLFCLVYLYKQTFAIPGSFIMNLLAGALFGVVKGSILACLLTGIGATMCFTMSASFCKPVFMAIFSRRITHLSEMVERNKDSLFFFLLGIRILPLSPNWLLNILSPLVGISRHLFFLTVLIGLIPYNVISVQAGTLLSQIDPEKSLRENMLLLTAVALIAIVPGIVVSKLRKKFFPPPPSSSEPQESASSKKLA